MRIFDVTLVAPRCVQGLDDTKNVTSVQLESEEARPLGPLIGKRVRLTGTPRPQRTSGDALPVVASVETITKL